MNSLHLVNARVASGESVGKVSRDGSNMGLSEDPGAFPDPLAEKSTPGGHYWRPTVVFSRLELTFVATAGNIDRS